MGAGPLAEAKQMLGLKLLNIQKCFVRFDEVRGWWRAYVGGILWIPRNDEMRPVWLRVCYS